MSTPAPRSRFDSLARRVLQRLAGGLALWLTLAGAGAWAQTGGARNGLSVTLPNGFARISAEDMRLKSTAGDVRWAREWNGQEWRFNPQWESLSQGWRNLTGSQAADTTGSVGGSGGSGGGNCWVTADDDFQPPAANGQGVVPMLAARSTPFNRAMAVTGSAYPQARRVLLDYTTLCPGVPVAGGAGDVEAFRRASGLYAGDNGAYAYSNRYTLRKQPVNALPAVPAASPYAQLGSGQITLAPARLANGFRWQDRGGGWIDYDNAGRAVAQGDRNDNTVWLQRDDAGQLRGVVDAAGRVLFTLHYTGELLTEVKDYPTSGNSLDLPARSVKYQYDAANRLTTVTDVRGNDWRYEYNAASRIVRVSDPEGRSEQLSYKGDTVQQRVAPDGGLTDYSFDFDNVNRQFVARVTGPQAAAGRRVDDLTHNRNGQLVRVVTNGRTDAQVSYDAAARTESLTNARGFTARTTRNEFDQVVQVQQTDGSVVSWTWSALHLQQMGFTDEAGIRSVYERDAKGNPTRLIQAQGTPEQRITEFGLNALGQITSVTAKGRTEPGGSVTPDATWQLRYDAQGQLSQTTDPEGHTRLYTYNRAGHLVREVDPRSNATIYEVDAAGNLVAATDALNRTRRLAYDKVGNLVSVTDARLKTLSSRYDAMNRLVQTTSAVGGIQQWQYDAQGNLVRQTDEDGRSDRFEFDTFLRLTRSVDGLGNATEHGYQVPDAPAQLASLFSPGQTQFPTFTQRSSYDARERPVRRSVINTNRQGTETLDNSTEYDARGLVTREVDAYGKARTSRYDALRQLIESTDRIGAATRMAYDARGNLIALTDANGHTHRFTYDRNDRLLSEALPLGQAIRYEYDAAGNVARRIDRNGNVFTYTHDAANRLVELRAVNAAGALQRSTTFTWDAEDNLTAWADTDAVRQQTARSELRYDDASRLTGETVTFPNGHTYTHGYRYTPAGLKTAIVWPDGTEIGYGYSAHGALQTVSIPGEGSITIQQYRWLAPQRTMYPGGVVREDSYDGLLSLEGSTVGKPTEPSLLSLSHRYGKLQELTQATRTDTLGTASTTRSSSYTYDDEVRLRQAATSTGTTTDTESFELDPLGNRTRHSRVNGAWAYDANHRLTRSGEGADATTYEWDPAGNLIRTTAPGGKVTVYEYDVLNRLSTVKDGAGNPIARYGYDPFDRRIWREVYRDIQGNPLAAPYRVLYAYNDEGLLAESRQAIQIDAAGVVTSTGVVEPQARHGQQPDSLFSTGALFVSAKDGGGRSIVAYLQGGHLEQPMQAIRSDGSVVWAGAFSPFGEASVFLPSTALDINNRFAGQTEDAETGLYYNYRRHFLPKIGRYVTLDPIGLLGGVNAYWYAGARPTGLIDPTGELTFSEEAGLMAQGIGMSFAAGIDGFIPFVDPLADLGLYDPCDPIMQFSQGLGGLWPGRLPLGPLAKLLPQAGKAARPITVLGENMRDRVIPFAEKTGARYLPFGAKKEVWDALTPRQRWKLNDGALRKRIREGDAFKYIGKDAARNPAQRKQFDLTRSELQRLKDRGIDFETVNPEVVRQTIGRQ